ncbi:MAG: hypothetical protein NC453_25965 [Muribaculum sp.]|nr:hypothetical protein [Muribaculum sp.]
MDNQQEIGFSSITNSKLYSNIISEGNIYNAIYSLDSYIFEKGLLSAKDLEIFYRLKDKYYLSYINDIIVKCQERLSKVLSSNEDLFDVNVFFKLKKYENGTIKYRPMHTASIIDQICMVCMLMPLMFDDSSGKRKMSDLSKLIPHNFFGNIPSTNVGFLFEKWQKKYKEYTDATISHCRKYQQNHKYHTEVTLDIKNFFPSINPEYIYDFMTNKLNTTYRTPIDKFCLEVVVSKLLYFKLKNEDIEDWLIEYYGKNDGLTGLKFYMSRGIPQGLPQSYLFGNLCMIDIKKRLDEVFQGDAYFYVDDSVIYIMESLKAADFKKRLYDLNKRLEVIWPHDKHVINDKLLLEKYISFQSKFDYIITFHTDEKSDFRLIDEADNHFGGYENIARGTSMLANPNNGLDEIDDSISLEKVNAYLSAVENEIARLVECQRKSKESIESQTADNNIAEEDNDGIINDLYSSRLKLMRRNKRFFLYRKRLLEVKRDGEYSAALKTDFENRFQLGKNINEVNKEIWFEMFDEDIFLSECFLIMEMFNIPNAERFKKQISDFELELSSKKSNKSLYFNRVLEASLGIKNIYIDVYKSLKIWIRKNYKENRNLGQSKQLSHLIDFIEKQKNNMWLRGFDGVSYTRFVFWNSMEFRRMIINAYYSEMIGVMPSDDLSFVKSNARQITYTELRILAQLRNRKFNCEDFVIFVKTLDPHDLSNRMGIDMGILAVLGHFIVKVKHPEWIDSLIQTHRVVKGLWYNGSKFLNSYTLHNEEHAVTLINKAIRLVKTIDYLSIKSIDYYILFLACYLHDISMVLHPDLYGFNQENSKSLSIITDFITKLQTELKKYNEIDHNDDKNNRLKEAGNLLVDIFQQVFEFFEASVRDPHPFESAAYIRSSADRFFKHICPAILANVATVSESHGYNSEEVYGLRSHARNDLVSIKYLMMLIRLADLLDVANDRVNYHLLRENVKHMSKTSRFHWISHLITDEIQLTAKYDVDEKKRLNEKPIAEHLNFDLYLNFKYLPTSDLHGEDKCEKCGMYFTEGKIDDPKPSEEYAKSRCMSLIIGSSCVESCPFLCRWVMTKHGWLVNELFELQNYLYSVNTSLIHTNIRLNIFYRDEYNLDADMLDYVKEYLKEL